MIDPRMYLNYQSGVLDRMQNSGRGLGTITTPIIRQDNGNDPMMAMQLAGLLGNIKKPIDSTGNPLSFEQDVKPYLAGNGLNMNENIEFGINRNPNGYIGLNPNQYGVLIGGNKWG